MQHPNIILILTDQQSSTMMGCAGNPHVRTPNMDRLAARGMRFTRAYCTNPVCVPSRVSLLTGRMPGEFGGNYNEAPWRVGEDDCRRTMGQLIRKAGYDAVYGGKVHVPAELHPGRTGYDYFCDDERGELAERCAEFIRAPHERPFFLVASFINPHDICYHAIRSFPNAATEKLRRNSPKEMAALDQALKRPESVGEEEFWTRHCPPLPPNHAVQRDEPDAITAMIRLRDFKRRAREEWTEQDWRMHRWAYVRLTEMVDAEIGTVLDAVDCAGIADHTLIVFTSDHGDHDAAHKLEHKTAFYEEAARIPFLISLPGRIPAGAVDRTTLVSNGLDLLPTLCDYAGAAVPASLRGRSLRPRGEGRDCGPWRDALYLENEFGFAVVGDRYKYALYREGAGTDEQLYDLKEDPGETRNAAADPVNAPILEHYRDRLAAFQREIYGETRRVQDFQ